MSERAASRPAAATVALIYLCGVAQGLALVAFPATSAVFASPSGFGLTGGQYGAMFIPQVAMAILASALAPRVARRIGMRGALIVGLSGDLAAMALLATSPLLIGSGAAYAALCVATAALGLGFGATVTVLNTLVEGLFPERADAAVLALNALLGLGTALAPLLAAAFAALGAWWGLPLAAAVALAVLLTAGAALRAPLGSPAGAAAAPGGLPPRFWLYAAATFLYGVVETLGGNWATLYLALQRHVPAPDASLALSAFWLMVTVGRVVFALGGRWLAAKQVYIALPIALALVFQIVARVDSAAAGIAAFAAAGLACSAMLPLSVSFGGAEFPGRAAAMSGALIAFYQVGYGVAAFGVGPLHEWGGFDYSTAYSAGGVVALALAAVAVLVVRRPARG